MEQHFLTNEVFKHVQIVLQNASKLATFSE